MTKKMQNLAVLAKIEVIIARPENANLDFHQILKLVGIDIKPKLSTEELIEHMNTSYAKK